MTEHDTMTDTVDISGIDKATLLAALYNRAHPQGSGFLHYDPAHMTREQAENELVWGDDLERMFPGANERRRVTLYFDYLRGRVMKVDLSGDTLDLRLYNLDNGPGEGQLAVQLARQGVVR